MHYDRKKERNANMIHEVIFDSLKSDQGKNVSLACGYAIALMTHSAGVEYMDYVRAIKSNPIAKAVKLADLKHNSDLGYRLS